MLGSGPHAAIIPDKGLRMDIVERLRFDAARCEVDYSKGVATNIEEGAAEIERLRAALQEIADMPPLRSFNSDGSPGGVYDAEQKVARRALEQQPTGEK
jgi:hypothetical protein